MKTGRSAISAPQSGMTNWDAKSRMPFQMFWRSSIGRRRPSRTHSFGEPATRT